MTFSSLSRFRIEVEFNEKTFVFEFERLIVGLKKEKGKGLLRIGIIYTHIQIYIREMNTCKFCTIQSTNWPRISPVCEPLYQCKTGEFNVINVERRDR